MKHDGIDTLTTAQGSIAAVCAGLLFGGLPMLGIYLALTTGNPWWLWLIFPLIALMEGGLFLIAIILTVVWGVMGV